VSEVHNWSKSQLLARVRNKVAYHVDASDVEAGLARLLKGGEPWLIARGDDARLATTQITLGYEPLFLGLAISRRDMRDFMRGVRKRQGVSNNLQELFLAVLRKKGLTLS
jgi:hypothetical protein